MANIKKINKDFYFTLYYVNNKNSEIFVCKKQNHFNCEDVATTFLNKNKLDIAKKYESLSYLLDKIEKGELKYFLIKIEVGKMKKVAYTLPNGKEILNDEFVATYSQSFCKVELTKEDEIDCKLIVENKTK